MGGSSAIPPTASLFRERFIYDEQPFLRGYERATGRFWRKAAGQGHVRSWRDSVAKVDNRTTPKISQKLIFSQLRHGNTS